MPPGASNAFEAAGVATCRTKDRAATASAQARGRSSRPAQRLFTSLLRWQGSDSGPLAAQPVRSSLATVVLTRGDRR